MATKERESVAHTKETRGTSPSFPRQTDSMGRRKSLNPGALATSSETKPVPNYLRATKSSSVNPIKPQVRKPSSVGSPTTTVQKPAASLSRRRSLDKPPSTSQLQKPSSTISRDKNLRSSSFTATNLPKSQADRSSRTTIGKSLSANSRSPGNTRKTSSTTTIQKQRNASATASKLKPITTDLPHKSDRNNNNNNNVAENVPQPESENFHQDDQEPSVTEVEDNHNISPESNSGMPADVLVLDDKDHIDVTDDEPEHVETEIKTFEPSLISDDEKTVSPASATVEAEESKEEIHIAETDIKIEETEQNNDNFLEESPVSELNVDVNLSKKPGESNENEENGEDLPSDKKEEVDKGKAVDSKETSEEVEQATADNHVKSELESNNSIAIPENQVESETESSNFADSHVKSELENSTSAAKPENQVESETESSNFAEKPDSHVKSELENSTSAAKPENHEKSEPESSNSAAESENHVKREVERSYSGARPQGEGVGNKKDSAAYNDVIEETATKLREQRKNKVLALVGAFETVMSLQEPDA